MEVYQVLFKQKLFMRQIPHETHPLNLSLNVDRHLNFIKLSIHTTTLGIL